jgi:glycosyltransferase involved in cell wall biosynthesis
MYACVRRHVRALHRARPFDAVLGAYAYPDLVAASRLADDLALPLVGFVLGSDINELAQRRGLQPQIKEALRRCSSVIAVSKGLRDRVVELGIPPERVIVQYNGVEGDVFALRDRAEARTALGLPPGQALVCFVGNLVPEKGPDVLVRALAQAPGVHAAVIGGGPMLASLEAEAARLGVRNRIAFLGRQPATVVAQWLTAANLLCLSSRREGCPNVVLEALASGRPVVGTAVGGVPELVTPTSGILVAADEPDNLARAIVSALERDWDPVALRASVPSLSWADLGRALYSALEAAEVSGRQN